MPADNLLDPLNFRRMLTRNVWLPLGLGAISALLFVGLLYYLLSTLRWVEHSTQVISETRDVAELSADMESSMRGFLNSGAERFLENFHTGSARIAAEIDAVVQLTADNPAQSDRMRTISVLQKQWIGLANELIAGRQRGENVETLVNSSRARPVRMQIRQDLRQFLAEESRLSRERSSTASTAVPIASAVFLIFTLGVSLLLAAFGRGELKRIASAYDLALEEARVREHKANELVWLRDGQRRLAESVVGKLQMEALGRNALEFFASYLGSVVGAFYVRQGDGTLRRTASWGLSAAHSGAQQAFGSGDSLVAEAAAGRRQFQLDDLPEGYIRVTSGLGHAAPRSLLVSPVYNEDSVSGVIELGFLRPIAPRDSELLQLASDALGAAMEAARYRERQQLLVSESQQLNEELQVQQEELRTANEELEEQTRALKESQGHLETQQAELEQTNEHLSQQRDALDERNDALKAAQLELQLRADELQSASRYKSEFLANMSHELRTPLNSSLILAKLLSDNPDANLNAEQVKFAESIYSAGNDLLGLINDILDISKVEAGKLEIRPEITRVASLADALRRTFEPLAGTKKLGFDVTLAPDLPATFFTDRQRVEQILKNLLSNAFKFTDLGRVALHIERSGGSGIAFKVQDSGIGIAPEQHQVIFEAFRQADGTTSRRYGGTGLGLSISRNLAGLLGGAIEIFSTPGKGSTFRLELPLQYEISQPRAAPKHTAPPNTSSPRLPDPPPAPLRALRDAPVLPREPAPRTQPPAPHAAFPDDRSGVLAPLQRRVLVVEDDAEFARILFELAHELGYHCLVASQADEALVLAESMAPDAILLDIRLPDASGLALLQQLKEGPRTRHLPVHVISAEDLSEPAMQMGAIGYSIKPTTREQLREVFASVERKLAQKVKRVLLVEDDARQRESIAALIGDDDIEIVAVERGDEALELLHSSIFDCMIIDLKLPDMSGNDLLRRMSAEDIRSFPPVVVYTGRDLSRTEEADLQQYSRSIIIKGARSPERLLDEVTLFLHKVESGMSLERQRMLKVARHRDKVFEGRRVLVVDDDVRNIFALTSALEYKGALVEIARNGIEALDKLKAVPGIDLVLMDMMMPVMDGYGATREIRKNPAWAKLPVIAVTAQAMKDDQERCLQAGCNDYLAKPIELERLFSLIRVWMPKGRYP